MTAARRSSSRATQSGLGASHPTASIDGSTASRPGSRIGSGGRCRQTRAGAAGRAIAAVDAAHALDRSVDALRHAPRPSGAMEAASAHTTRHDLLEPPAVRRRARPRFQVAASPARGHGDRARAVARPLDAAARDCAPLHEADRVARRRELMLAKAAGRASCGPLRRRAGDPAARRHRHERRVRHRPLLQAPDGVSSRCSATCAITRRAMQPRWRPNWSRSRSGRGRC